MIIVVLVSVTSLVIDVQYDIPNWLNNFDLYFVTIVFIVEYILRIWVYSDIKKIIIEEYEERIFFGKKLSLIRLYIKIFKDKWNYISSLPSIIDLLAILPSYRGLRALRNPHIHNLFDAFYWALVTISTVGYGDIVPVTPEGRAVSMLIIATGVGLIAFITSVIVSAFSERILREEKVFQDMSKKRHLTVLCGYGLLGRLVAKG